MRPRRMLFTCRPLAGHFHPLLPLAEAAVEAGHIVAFASGDPVVRLAREAGYITFDAGPGESFREEWAPGFPDFRTLVGDAQRAFFFTKIFADLELEPRAADLDGIMETWQPDVVVHDVAELAAPLVATDRHVPYVDVGFGPLIPRGLLQAAGAAAAAHWRDRNLAPHPLAGLFRYLYIDPCPAALQSSEIADVAAVQGLRPALPEPRAVEPPAWRAGLADRPTVYVTLGTIWNTDLDLFRLVIGALSDMANVFVTIGRQRDPAQLGPQPSNVIVRSYVPQNEVLPWCDAVVAHGGAGTTLGALACGLPLLVVPQGADQWHNADVVVAAGAGRRLLSDEVSTDAVREAVSALLDEPAYRESASDVRDEILAMPTGADAIAAIEALL